MALESGGPLTAAASEETDAETPANGMPAYEVPENGVSPAEAPVPETPEDEAVPPEMVPDEAPVDEAPVDELSATETPVTDEPVTDEPVTDATVTDVPAAETYPGETPLVNTGTSETSAADTPPAGIPAADGPTTEARPDATDRPDDGPLLPDASDLRANWQRVQASFVDDPRTAVAEAADLVDHVAQALAGALRQRQTRLREQWDTDGPEPETERLRVTLQQYRAVFNQICRG